MFFLHFFSFAVDFNAIVFIKFTVTRDSFEGHQTNTNRREVFIIKLKEDFFFFKSVHCLNK